MSTMKKCKLVMLPSKEKAPIWKHAGELHLNKSEYEDWKSYQHVYITSDDKITNDNWYIDLFNKDNVKFCDNDKLAKKLNLKKSKLKK